MKHKCYKCHKMATWLYIPDSSRTEASRYFCDDCVGRGCSCNIIPETDPPREELDDLGRFFPCCEYLEDINGFEVE